MEDDLEEAAEMKKSEVMRKVEEIGRSHLQHTIHRKTNRDRIVVSEAE